MSTSHGSTMTHHHSLQASQVVDNTGAFGWPDEILTACPLAFSILRAMSASLSMSPKSTTWLLFRRLIKLKRKGQTREDQQTDGGLQDVWMQTQVQAPRMPVWVSWLAWAQEETGDLCWSSDGHSCRGLPSSQEKSQASPLMFFFLDSLNTQTFQASVNRKKVKRQIYLQQPK